MGLEKEMKTVKTLVACAALLGLTACAGMNERVSRIGQAPAMSQIENPYQKEGYQPVSLPMPPVVAANTASNSLWQSGRQTFFKDQRAHKVGDILTVMITISDKATMENKTERSRTGGENQGLPSFLGWENAVLGKVLPDAANPASLVGMNSKSSSTGDGSIERNEEIKLKLAAMITQVLPNGNFIINGHQEVRVNHELRQLQLAGVIRPEDIMNNNAISYEKIAEARISYGGKGIVSDLQQPRYGQQFFDAVFPF